MLMELPSLFQEGKAVCAIKVSKVWLPGKPEDPALSSGLGALGDLRCRTHPSPGQGRRKEEHTQLESSKSRIMRGLPAGGCSAAAGEHFRDKREARPNPTWQGHRQCSEER